MLLGPSASLYCSTHQRTLSFSAMRDCEHTHDERKWKLSIRGLLKHASMRNQPVCALFTCNLNFLCNEPSFHALPLAELNRSSCSTHCTAWHQTSLPTNNTQVCDPLALSRNKVFNVLNVGLPHLNPICTSLGDWELSRQEVIQKYLSCNVF